MQDLKSRYDIGWFSAYDTLKGMVVLYGYDKVLQALIEIHNGVDPLPSSEQSNAHIDRWQTLSGLTKRAADTAPRCPKCGSPLVKDETRERSYICSNSGACR